jgi:hypothetical protein
MLKSWFVNLVSTSRPKRQLCLNLCIRAVLLNLLCLWSKGDFIKKFTHFAWNLRSAPIFFYSNLALCICVLGSTNRIFSQTWVRSTLYAVRPNFMKSTPVLTFQDMFTANFFPMTCKLTYNLLSLLKINFWSL